MSYVNIELKSNGLEVEMEDISAELRWFLTQHWNGWSPGKVLARSEVVVSEINKGRTYIC
jgi:hypothetical protein